MEQIEQGHDGLERDFCEALTRAEAEAKVRLAGMVSAAAPADWRASDKLDLTKLTDDELEQLERLYDRAAE